VYDGALWTVSIFHTARVVIVAMSSKYEMLAIACHRVKVRLATIRSTSARLPVDFRGREKN